MTHAPASLSAVPSVDASEVVVPAPGEGEGYWAGGPSAVYADGTYTLAYRLRRPGGSGRGYFEAAGADGGNDLRTQLVDVDGLRALLSQ